MSSSSGSSPQDRIQHVLGQLDKELAKYPALNNLEKHTSVPKAYSFLGLVALYFFLIVFNLGGQFLTNLAGFALPGYYSLEALFTSSKVNETQWLTYWVVFAFFTLLESLVNILYWFPFYFTFKFVFLLWLSLPTFGGAEIIFHSFLQPVFGRYFQGGSGSTASGLRAKADSSLRKDD